MQVHELISHLQQLPQDNEVSVFWDGGAYSVVEGIVNTDSEVVIVGEWSCYRDGQYRAYPEEQIVYG